MSTVLLLNASYEPLRVISLERAMGLVLKGRAEMVEAAPGRVLRSPSVTAPMPSVLRLRRYVNVPRRHATWTRRGVLARDGYTCAYCGKRMRPADATVDHVVPQWLCRQGGLRRNTWGNTVACCHACQKRKGHKTMEEAGMRFHRADYEPKIPRVNYLVVTSDIAPEWRQYIRM